MQQTSNNMPTKAELKNKLQEVHAAVVDMEMRLKGLPYRQETEEMRKVMFKMVKELHRMEDNITAMLQMDDENRNGGNADGNY